MMRIFCLTENSTKEKLLKGEANKFSAKSFFSALSLSLILAHSPHAQTYLMPKHSGLNPPHPKAGGKTTLAV